ncbi:MAG: ribonuclease HII [bacterium]|nr:ribonuclease HII [bacterium]
MNDGLSIDSYYSGLGYRSIAGVDEAGRGALAGPVCAASVILGGEKIDGLNDSKKLSPHDRDVLYDKIFTKAQCVGVGMAGPGRIDEINILMASLEAMTNAVRMMSESPDIVLVDGNIVPAGLDNAVAIVKGDTKSQSIMAASIIAKVTRDRYMLLMDKSYPGFGFAQHKGYAVKAHYEALDAIGVTPIHRLSFEPCRKALESLIETGKIGTISAWFSRETHS